MKHRLILITVIFMTALVLHGKSTPLDSCTVTKSDKFRFSGGSAAGVNLSGLIHSGVPGASSHMRVGFSGGGFVQLDVTHRFALEGDLMFQYRQSGFKSNPTSGDFCQWSAQVAIYANLLVPMRHNSTLYLGIGPYTDFGLSATYKSGGIKHNLYNRNESAAYPSMATSETGIGLKIGYELQSGIRICAGYRISISNLAEIDNNGVHLNPQTVDLSIAYRFGRK